MSEFFQNFILRFPSQWQFSVSAVGQVITDAVKTFARENASWLDKVVKGINLSIAFIRNTLSAIPWIVLILLVMGLTWYFMRKWRTALLYGLLLAFIGCCNLWAEMLQTLSVVIFSVLVCMLLGFPLGILLAMSKRASEIMRPVLDTMQTIPSWIYLIPMVLLFGTGTPPAFFATVIYGIVPMIRMTSHALTHVDPDMLEASSSYGATRIQTLLKVQIPQAKPTIMTGINQTIMMCMSMVVTSALVGANGLGMEILVPTNQVKPGQALFPGICVVIIAVILDRLTQAAIKRTEVEKHD